MKCRMSWKSNTCPHHLGVEEGCPTCHDPNHTALKRICEEHDLEILTDLGECCGQEIEVYQLGQKDDLDAGLRGFTLDGPWWPSFGQLLSWLRTEEGQKALKEM